eukprot:33347-Amphidinium_carterae.1
MQDALAQLAELTPSSPTCVTGAEQGSIIDAFMVPIELREFVLSLQELEGVTTVPNVGLVLRLQAVALQTEVWVQRKKRCLIWGPQGRAQEIRAEIQC